MSKTAFLFPGQGSQQVGMLESVGDEPAVRQAFAEASGALGYDLWDVIRQGPAERLDRTDITQPALLAAGVALWKLWEQRGGLRPDLLAGHSLGEYTALACAGVFSLGDGVRLVELRGRLMQEAVPAGAGRMAAILGLDDDAVREACAEGAQGAVVEAVNFNAPGQVVIAGDAAAVDRAIEACRARGARRAMPLAVSVPSHCALMRPAAERLAEALDKVNFHLPEVPVLNNVDVMQEREPARIRDALVRQLHSPVRWVEIVQALGAQGVTRAGECGPGKVLAGLVRRIDADIEVFSMDSTAALDAALAGGQQ